MLVTLQSCALCGRRPIS